MRGRVLRLLAGAAAMGVAMSAGAPAWAADRAPAAVADDAARTGADDQRETADEVIVNGRREKSGETGAKTKTPLIALPQTVTVIDNDELTRRNALSINQALGYVAGVAPNQRGNVATRYDQLFIRGFTPGQYMDGMRLLGGVYATPQIDFHLVESVDVIKGPASVLYGNSTPGGLVNLTSKVPYAEAGGRIELAGGNFDLWRSSVDVNQPLDRAGRWQFRVIAGAEQSDGFIARTGNRRYYARPMLRFAPDDATSVTLILGYQRDPESASYSGVPAYGSALPNPFGTLPRDLNVSEPGYEAFDREQKSATLLFRHDFSPALSWSTNARYLDVDLHYRQIYLSAFATTGAGAARRTDFSTIVRGGGGADEAFRTITFDNRLSANFSTGPVEHTLLVGVDWQNNRGNNDQGFVTGVNANRNLSVSNFNLFAPVYGAYTLSSDVRIFPGVTRNFRKIDQVGVYAQDQLKLGGLNLIASGRYDWYEQLTRNRNLAAGATGAVTQLQQTAFTGRLGALYETRLGLAPFVSYSESFEPQAGTTFAGTPFVPVTGRQYEAGLKYQPRGTRALFTFSAFDLRRQNVPASDPVNTGFSVQVGEAKVRGLELDGRGEVLPGLNVTVAGTYTEAEFTRGNPRVGTGDQLSGITGTRLLGVPKWSASSFVSYDLEKVAQGPLGGFNLGGGVRYVGKSDGTAQYVAAGATVTQRFSSPGYVLADLLVGYDLGAASEALKGLDLSLNVANLFDKRHIASCFFNNSCYYGAARTVVGTLRARW